MSDILASYKLTDRDFRRGLENVEKATHQHAARQATLSDRIGGSFRKTFMDIGNVGRASMMGIGTAAALASKAVLDYADKNSYVRAQLDDLRAASQETWHAIGRDIASSGALKQMADFVRWVERGRQATVDFIALGMGAETTDTHIGVHAKRDAEKNRAEAIAKLDAESRARVLEMSGDTFNAARIRAELDRDQKLNALNTGVFRGNSTDKNKLQERYRFEYEVAIAAARKEQNEREKIAKERADSEARRDIESFARENDRAREEQERRKAAEIDAGFQMRAMEIERRRAEGQTAWADAAQKRLDAEREIARINANELLSEETRAKLIESVRRREGQRDEAMKESEDRINTRSLNVSGRANLSRMVFNGQASDTASNKLLKVGESQLAVLREIARKPTGGPAVFG